MSSRLKTFEQTTAFVADVDRAKDSVAQVLAHWHNVGQSHWTGGSLRSPDGGSQNDAPAAHVQAAFQALRDAQDALIRASHELTMHSLTLPPAAAEETK